MTPETSPVRRRAVQLSSDVTEIIGPLSGYHHEAYAFPLPADSPLRTLHGFGWGKLRVPRSGLFWFDRRCFRSEDFLLRALQRLPARVTRVPPIVEVADGVILQGFVVGSTLGAVDGGHGGLSERHLGQLARFFEEISAVPWEGLRDAGAERVCDSADRTKDGDSAQFLRRLIRFTGTEVYERRGTHYRDLFASLGFGREPLELLTEQTWSVGARPHSLLHGDLHRNNLVVDTAGALWFIDWELAMVGDPLYDLATHLHLMRYPEQEAKRVSSLWAAAVERGRRGSAQDWEKDLPLLLAYKAVQSVYTDVIRAAVRLGPGPRPDGTRLADEAAAVHGALVLAHRRMAGLGGSPRWWCSEDAEGHGEGGGGACGVGGARSFGRPWSAGGTQGAGGAGGVPPGFLRDERVEAGAGRARAVAAGSSGAGAWPPVAPGGPEGPASPRGAERGGRTALPQAPESAAPPPPGSAGRSFGDGGPPSVGAVSEAFLRWCGTAAARAAWAESAPA